MGGSSAAMNRRLGVDVFTTGQVAKMVGVAPRTVSKWLDAGRLKGYRIPGSQDRRVVRGDLVAFLRDNGMPTDAIVGRQSGGGRVLAVGMGAEEVAHVSAVTVEGSPVVAESADDDLDAWAKVIDGEPDVVIAAGARCGLLWRVRARLPRVWLVWVGSEYDTADVTAKAAEVCDVLVPFPHSPADLTAAVRGWREDRAKARPVKKQPYRGPRS